MILFTVTGERNSGTHFIERLIEENEVRCVGDLTGILNRHRIPEDSIKTMGIYGERMINIIVFRKLDSWLVSMYKNSYFLEKKEESTFEDFLIRNQKSCFRYKDEIEAQYYIYSDKELFSQDTGKTVFEIRYSKIKSFLDFYNRHKDVILVSLEYLQNEENCKKFIKDLNSRYELNIKNVISSIERHTKRSKLVGVKNRIYEDVKITGNIREIINKHRNPEIESFIEDLTYRISS